MLWAGLAALGIVAGVAVLHPGRGLGLVEDPPPLPSVDLPLPSVDLPLPSVDLSSPLPLPSVDLSSPLPLPSVDLSSPLPSVDLSSPLPLPSVDLTSPQPAVDDPDQSPTSAGLDVDPAPSAPEAPAEPTASVTPLPTGDNGAPAGPDAGAPTPTGAGGGDGPLGALTLPALIVGIPLLVLLAFIATQVAAGAVWLPVIRRVLGRGRPGDADAALPDQPQEPSAG